MVVSRIRLGKKPTYRKFAEDIDFTALFGRIEARFDTCYLLESLGEDSRLSRYSIIGFDPHHTVSARGNVLTLDGKDYPVDNPYYALRDLVPQDVISRNYAGGLVGYLGYEAMNYFEPSLDLAVHERFDPFQFGVYKDGLVLDTMTNELFYFHYDDNRMNLVEDVMNDPEPTYSTRVKMRGDSMTREQHSAAVEAAKEEIRAGNTFQCQIGFKREFSVKGSSLPLYRKLREVNPSPFMYYLKHGKNVIVGASPELLFRMNDRFMETFPLAGTIRRGSTDAEDLKLARTLLNDPKEIAEHNMLVDLHRNDIGRVAEFGSVKVRSLMDVKRFSHVQHISSEITGIMKRGEDMFSALASNFPAGTLSGAPKIESMKIIDRCENSARGPYGGALGHFGFNGNAIFAIPIRTLFVSGEDAYTQASGGIVFDSTAEGEYDEVQRKMAAITQVMHAFA